MDLYTVTASQMFNIDAMVNGYIMYLDFLQDRLATSLLKGPGPDLTQHL